ncbi:MAG: GNAT family protein [Bacteroidota bacterium]
MIDWTEPTFLKGGNVKLIPLAKAQQEDLLAAASDGELWNLWYTSVPSKETIDRYIATALQELEARKSLPFAVVDTTTNTIVGSTRYCNIDLASRRLEIGYTWYAKRVQRTGINTSCKYLLLQHAFEQYDAIAVELRTNWFNYRSRNAILRLGAKQDGVLRNHKIDHEGNLRDTVVFSIIASEWPRVKRSLAFEMGKYGG